MRIASVNLPVNWLNLSLTEISGLAPIQEISYRPWRESGISVSVKREDLLHEKCGGNKLYKLWGHLQAASQWASDHRYSQYALASFGGAYSNHLYALAAVGEQLAIPTIGIVRGEQTQSLSETLKDCLAMGMSLHFISRSDYRCKDDPALRQQLKESLCSDCPLYWIAEGGGGLLGMEGVKVLAEGMLRQSSQRPDFLATAVGTGTTLAGLTAGLPASVSSLGIAVLKGAEPMRNEIRTMLASKYHKRASFTLCCDYHCGGYAKLPVYLRQFMSDFEQETRIPLDPVYTAKLFWAITKLAEDRYWSSGTHILALHSGGLQGRRGFDLE